MNAAASTRTADRPARPIGPAGQTGPTARNIHHDFQGSPKMHSMYEALARDRMRESEQRSADARLTRSLAAQRRWHRVTLRAQAAEQRHALRVSEVLPLR